MEASDERCLDVNPGNFYLLDGTLVYIKIISSRQRLNITTKSVKTKKDLCFFFLLGISFLL